MSVSQRKRSLATLIKPLSTHAHFYADSPSPSKRESMRSAIGTGAGTDTAASPFRGEPDVELPEVDEDGVVMLDAYRSIRILLR